MTLLHPFAQGLIRFANYKATYLFDAQKSKIKTTTLLFEKDGEVQDYLFSKLKKSLCNIF